MIEIKTTLNSKISLDFIDDSNSSTTFTLNITNTSNSIVKITSVYCKISPCWIFFSKKIKFQHISISIEPKQYVELEYPFSKILNDYPDKKITICVEDSNGNIYTN